MSFGLLSIATAGRWYCQARCVKYYPPWFIVTDTGEDRNDASVALVSTWENGHCLVAEPRA